MCSNIPPPDLARRNRGGRSSERIRLPVACCPSCCRPVCPSFKALFTLNFLPVQHSEGPLCQRARTGHWLSTLMYICVSQADATLIPPSPSPPGPPPSFLHSFLKMEKQPLVRGAPPSYRGAPPSYHQSPHSAPRASSSGGQVIVVPSEKYVT